MSSKPIATVTGGCGFIGSHMVDLLVTHGFTVNVVDNLVGGRTANIEHHGENGDVRFFNMDIRDLEPGHEAFGGVRFVFHFAGIGDIVPSIERPVEYMSVNVQGTVKVLECARAAGAQKLVYAASSSCYGLADVPTDEAHLIDTKYPYALSKYQGEQAVLHWQKVYGLPANCIRIFNAYGTRSRTSGAYGAVFGVFLKQKLEGAPLTIVGDGFQTRDFLYVTDVARAFYAAADTDIAGEIYNLGAGKPQSVNHLASLLGGETVFIPKRPGEPDCTWANISKITSELNWQPKVSFEEGVERILDNIDYWRDAPLWNTKNIAEATKTWFQYMQE
ncbi:MAG: GDP-mannose 4,6-dehydratase [Kordiimonadaceae bacterium]|nr:GDP-mannose 4,6-dehydratase [Kordiimonadaceae bacterium]MBO6568421.1 GDP-mannose 4,6-dehydratase [Kordiimonadaceae bacterium]MBO6963850.1 GDP-mannose 4,6-dehydratase [Kordiimonadaceae bacterium]